MQFLHLGFKDYIGARTLLRAGLPLQGAVLGSTAIEKYFKAFGHARGNYLRGHLHSKHIRLVRNFLPDLFAKLNLEFLTFLQRCYDLRYTDRLPPDFNLTVFARETLAELDLTVYHCDGQIRLHRGEELILSPFARALQSRSELLCADNHVLAGIDKLQFLGQPDRAYSVRNQPIRGLLEVEFTVPVSPKDGKFNRVALRRLAPSEVPQRPSGAPEAAP